MQYRYFLLSPTSSLVIWAGDMVRWTWTRAQPSIPAVIVAFTTSSFVVVDCLRIMVAAWALTVTSIVGDVDPMGVTIVLVLLPILDGAETLVVVVVVVVVGITITITITTWGTGRSWCRSWRYRGSVGGSGGGRISSGCAVADDGSKDLVFLAKGRQFIVGNSSRGTGAEGIGLDKFRDTS